MKNLILLYNLLFVFQSTIFAQTITYTIESTFSDNNVYVSSCDLLMQIESTFSDDNVYVYNPNNANSTEINDLIEDLRDATFSWYGYFEANSTATYNNNVNSLNFKKASGVDTAYLDISGSEGYDGRYPLDDFWGELDLVSQGNWGRISFENHPITLGGVELNVDAPSFYFPNNNIYNTTLSPNITRYTYQLNSDWSVEFEAGEYPNNISVDVSSYGSGGIGDIIADSDGDNVRDSIDAFDNDPTETTDSDSDGVGDNSDAFPNDTNETVTLTKLSENGFYTLSEIQDIRAGSTMIAVENGQATLSMEVEESDDLEIWTSGGTTNLQIPVDANSDTKFYRFKMTE